MTDQSQSMKKKKVKRFQVEDCFNYYGPILRIVYDEKNKTYNKTEIADKVAEIALKNQRIDPSNTLTTYIPRKFKNRRGQDYEGLKRKEIAFAAIDHLAKVKLLDRRIDLENNNREKKFKLSDRGTIIARFLKEMDEYQDSYFKLKESIEGKIPHLADTSILEKYDSRWKKNEIPFYYKFRYDCLDLNEIFDKNFMNIVLLRYAKIINSSYSLHNTKLKIILNDLIVRLIEKRTRYMLFKYKIYRQSGEAITKMNERELNTVRSKLTYETEFRTGKEGRLPFFQEIKNYFRGRRIIPSLIETEVKNMIFAYLYLLDYPKEFETKEIDKFLKNKDKLAEEDYNKNKNRQVLDYYECESEYEFKHLIKLIYDTDALFLKTLREYVIT